MLRDLRRSRGLAWRLAIRDITGQYRQAVLGILWAFIVPLANTITWVFLSSAGIVKVADTSIPYPIYVFTGTMLWAIFMDAVNAPLAQVNSAKSMLTKLQFPREALILSGVYQTIFNACIKVMLMTAVVLYSGILPGWTIFLFPIGVASLIVVGTAIGLLITPVGMLYTDIGKGITLTMQFVMYVTPVVFHMPKSGWAASLFAANPLTPVILTTRDWLTGQEPAMIGNFVVISVIAVAVLAMAWALYRLAMPILIERMGG